MYSIIHRDINVNGFFNWALILCLFVFIYYLFIYSKEINVKKCFDFLFYAVVISSACGLVFYQIGEMKSVIYPFDGTYNRLRLFTLNVNHLAMLCSFGIAYAIYDIINFDFCYPRITFLTNGFAAMMKVMKCNL